MKGLSVILATLLIASCGPKPIPPPPKPKVMSFKLRGKTYTIKAKLKVAAKYEAVDLKKKLETALKTLDDKM